LKSETIYSRFFRHDSKLDEHFGDDGEEGGFGHRTAGDALVDGDHFVEFLHLFALIEAVEKEFYFVFEFRGKGVSLGARHPRAGAGADRDELCGFFADLLELRFLFGGVDGALDESDVEFVEDVFGLEDARVTNVEDFAPRFEVIVHNLGKDHCAVLATGEGEPTDAKFFVRLFLMLLHSTNMVA